MVRKNMRVRKAMMETGVTQYELANRLGTKQPNISFVLAGFELSAFEQADMIKLIRDIAEEKGEVR